MNIEHDYEVSVNWATARHGVLSSPDLPTTIVTATPPEFPKGEEGIWSPEHLFVAAVNSCLMTTFLAIAENSKLEFSQFSSEAVGKLCTVDGKYMMCSVTLNPHLKIFREEDREKAERILKKSEAACLITNSIKSEIVFNPEISIKEIVRS